MDALTGVFDDDRVLLLDDVEGGGDASDGLRAVTWGLADSIWGFTDDVTSGLDPMMSGFVVRI